MSLVKFFVSLFFLCSLIFLQVSVLKCSFIQPYSSLTSSLKHFKKRLYLFCTFLCVAFLKEFDRALKGTLIRFSDANTTCLNNYNTGVCVCVCADVNVRRTSLCMLTFMEIDTSHYKQNTFQCEVCTQAIAFVLPAEGQCCIKLERLI